MSQVDLTEEERLTARERELLERGRRSELVEEIRAVVRQEITDSMNRHFGGRSPEEVMEVMRAAERFHKRIEKLTESFWGTAIAHVLKWSLIVFLASQIFINSGTLQKFLPGAGVS